MSTPLPESELAEAASAAFDLCAGTPGAVVGVKAAAGTWSGSYGNADPDTPISAQTHLRIGSVTTTFTATVLLQFVEEGLVSLDDPVSMHLPDTTDITVRMLATMRSGIADYTADPGLVQSIIADPTAVHTCDEVIAVRNHRVWPPQRASSMLSRGSWATQATPPPAWGDAPRQFPPTHGIG